MANFNIITTNIIIIITILLNPRENNPHTSPSPLHTNQPVIPPFPFSLPPDFDYKTKQVFTGLMIICTHHINRVLIEKFEMKSNSLVPSNFFITDLT